MRTSKAKQVSLAAGAAVAAASLGAGAAHAGVPNNFQGYEPGDPQTWITTDGSSVTTKATGSAYGLQSLSSISGANHGILKPEPTVHAGFYADAGENRLPAYASFPGTFQFQAFIYLSNQLTASSGNNVNDIFWVPISVNEDLGGGNFTYAHSQRYAVKRTSDNVSFGTFGLYELGSGGGISEITVPGNAWYGIHEVYEEDPSGYGKVTGSWTKANGDVLGSFSTIFNGVGVPEIPNGGPWAGFRKWFPNEFDTSTNIDELGLPIDNVAVLFGTTMVIPPAIPEPASLVLLGAGTAVLLRRRRV